MSVIRKSLLAVAVSSSFVSMPASALEFLNDWYLCTDATAACTGTNYSSGIPVAEYLDIIGPSYVQTSVPDASGNFTFSEWGAFRITSVDGGESVPSVNFEGLNYLTATFTATGTATLGGSISFNPYDSVSGLGVINLYSDPVNNFGANDPAANLPPMYGADDGTLIATFYHITGGGLIDPTGIPNGQQTLLSAAVFLLPGYFFDVNGVDMSTLVDADPLTDPILFGFATTNASRVANPSAAIVQEIVNEFAGDASFGNVLPSIGTAGEFIIANNGQYRLAEVPEPASLGLLGLGLAAMGFAGRRRNRKL